MWIAALAWIAIAQGPTTPLSGTVVGPDGGPVVGAELVLVGLPSYDPPIVGRGTSGEGGRFSIDRPASLSGDHHPRRAPILWAVKGGFRASATRFPEALPKADEPIRIVLEGPGRAEVRVEGPDGRPAVGVDVLPERLEAHATNIPDVVAGLASAKTGADGRAVLDAVSQEELTYVDIHSREFGIQGRPIVPGPGEPAVIALRPVSTWKGRLAADDPGHARGWKVRAWSRVGFGPEAADRTVGYVEEATTDDQGRFTLGPIAVGILQLDLKPPGDLPVLADLPTPLAVREGDLGTVEIPLRKPIVVAGRVLERGTGRPVPGIDVSLSELGTTRNRNERVRTDGAGRYAFRSLPGQLRVGLLWPPKTHVLAPGQHWVDFPVPEGAGSIELATWEALPAAPPLRGEVRDEAGRPVAGAQVEATWMLGGSGGSSDGRIVTESDANGGFLLEGLGPESTVTITARLRDPVRKGTTRVRAGVAGPVTVAIVPQPVLAVAGRLLGPGGSPLAGVAVGLQVRVPRDDHVGNTNPVRFEGDPEIRTGPDGTFRTPRELERTGADGTFGAQREPERKPCDYRVEVSVDGFLPGRTPWVTAPEAGDLLRFPDLILKRSRGVRVVSGRVVDREGRPVAGASVSQSGDGPKWTTARPDADGRFRLAGVASGEALAFAEAPGFRFGGAIVGVGPFEIRLAREGEPPIAALTRAPPPLSRAEERALARDLIGPLLPLARSGSLGIENASVIPALARVDPARVLDLIEARAITGAAGGLIEAALGQFEDDPAAAFATIAADLDPGSRAAGWLALEDFRPGLDRPRREDLLDRALADARRAENVEVRLKRLGQVADRWLGLGSIERARPILVEGRGIVEAWPKDRDFSEAEDFAEVLAMIDLPAALALFGREGRTNVSPAGAGSIDRHKGRAAIRLARFDPAGAERLIAGPSPSFPERAEVVFEVASRMAVADLDRARRVLGTIADGSIPGLSPGPARIPFGLGAIAGELAGTDPDRARTLLDEAFAGLRRVAVAGDFGRPTESPADLMAELLPIVERLEPGRLAERAWLAAACRAPEVREPISAEIAGTFDLALLIGRYDPALARVIAGPAVEAAPGVFAELAGKYGGTLSTPRFLAAYDPRLVAPLLGALPESARRPPPKANVWTAASIEAQFRLGAAQVLGLPPRARARGAGRIGSLIPTHRLDD